MISTLYDFTSAGVTALWRPVNDAVMGGVSEGRLEPAGPAGAAFTGRVSLENNGGFASVRSTPVSYDLGAYGGLLLHVRGDGRRYRINLVDARSEESLLHAASFDTDGSRQAVRIPFDAFRPRRRGRSPADARPLDAGAIRAFGLMIAEGQEGPFRLEIERIAAYDGA